MRIGLVGCCKKKLDRAAPARELYQSDLFKSSVAWLEARDELDGWAILSAKHRLVMPDDVIYPYELSLADMNQRESLVGRENARATDGQIP